MKTLLVFLLTLFTCSLMSQRIYFTGEKRGSIDIIYTRHLWQADIKMHSVAYEHQAGRSRTRDGCDNWFVVENKWQADYVFRVVNSIHPGRKTLYVYRANNCNCTPPLRDRDDPNNQYNYDDELNDDEYINRSKTKIIIEPTVIFRFNKR